MEVTGQRWDALREEYQTRIKEITKSIDRQLRLYAETGNEEHLLFAQHEIQHLKDLKDYITNLEKQKGLY